MRLATRADAARVADPTCRAYLARFADASADLLATMERFGVPVEDEADARARRERVRVLRAELQGLGARERADGKSLVWGGLSPACERCRTGVRSVSTFLSLACDRSCWFCFNPNQHDYDRYHCAPKDWRAEVDGLAQALGGLDFTALTGGEPLLFPDETLAFVRHARALAPDGHVRLYTSGAQVSPAFMAELGKAGLDEIRFSVKLDEPAARQQAVLELISAAVGSIPCVMVEMPVVPGTEDAMFQLLDELEERGAFGVNLLELCFPLHNAEAFRERGLTLVREPYQVPYSYGYAGALPVAGSEELALRLMRRAAERASRLSLHWCSLENKNTAQIYEQNGGGALDIPPYRFSPRSFFYEVVRAFGADAAFCLERLGDATVPLEADEAQAMVAFDPAGLALFDPRDAETHDLWLASAVIEDGEGGRRFREVSASRIEADDLARGRLAGEQDSMGVAGQGGA
ncbi:MAG: radical SAM protein [Eggerthellaceae bacterium]|nr:radical SAM protein [Eggerthellaceae bacterium]